jgi:hypothetical protein
LSLIELVRNLITKYIEDIEIENTGETEITLILSFKDRQTRNLAYRLLNRELANLMRDKDE